MKETLEQQALRIAREVFIHDTGALTAAQIVEFARRLEAEWAKHPTLEECEAAGRGPDQYKGAFQESELLDTPEERSRFEAYMRGHCWSIGTYDESIRAYDTTIVRMLYGIWRDRGALAQKEFAGRQEPTRQSDDSNAVDKAGELGVTSASPANLEPWQNTVQFTPKRGKQDAAFIVKTPANLEPVAWITEESFGWLGEAQKYGPTIAFPKSNGKYTVPLYAIPPGCVVVPREPAEAMLKALVKHLTVHPINAFEAYRAMLSAASGEQSAEGEK